MKKFLLLLLIITSFYSCSSLKEKNVPIPIINNTWSMIWVINSENIPVINNTWFTIWKIMIEIPNNYELPKDDLKTLLKMINNDKEYFEINNDELDVFHVRRDFLYGEKYTNWNLISCLNKTINYNKLDWFDAEICKWVNEFIANEDQTWWYNTFHIKDTLIKLKKVKEWEKFDCKYFIDTSYEMGSIEEKLLTKIDDYFICKKLQNDSYPLLKIYYNFFRIIWVTKKENEKICNILNDENLIKLCNEKI